LQSRLWRDALKKLPEKTKPSQSIEKPSPGIEFGNGDDLYNLNIYKHSDYLAK
jgi:hypothetical protein